MHHEKHILIDLSDVQAHTLSMVDVYQFAKQVNCVSTGQTYVLGSSSLIVSTLISLSAKVFEEVAPLPCRFIEDKNDIFGAGVA